MSDRAQRQAEAERAVRRGELKLALQLYRGLLEGSPAGPDDEQLRARIATIESLLQPQELTAASPALTPALDLGLSRPSTLEQAAELQFERGDLAGAVATYEQVLRERPGHDLARERCAELKRLAELGASGPAPRQPSPPAAQALPQSRPELLEALLQRIATRRKP